MANLMKNFFDNFESITKYYNYLVNKTKNHEYVEITNEWLIDNYYLLVEHKNNILNSKSLIKKNLKNMNQNHYFLKNIVSKKNYNISFKYLVEELREYQKENNVQFSYQSLSSIFNSLVFIYTEKLNELCKEEHQKLIDKEEVLKTIQNNDEITIENLIPKNFDLLNRRHYIFEVNNELHRVGNSSNELFKKLNEYLQNNNISIKELINEEYQNKIDNNLLISKIFNDFK